MGAELTAKFAFCSILEHGFGDIIVYEWIQTGVKNTRNRRFFNVVLATFLYMNGFKPVSELTARLTFSAIFFTTYRLTEAPRTRSMYSPRSGGILVC